MVYLTNAITAAAVNPWCVLNEGICHCKTYVYRFLLQCRFKSAIWLPDLKWTCIRQLVRKRLTWLFAWGSNSCRSWFVRVVWAQNAAKLSVKQTRWGLPTSITTCTSLVAVYNYLLRHFVQFASCDSVRCFGTRCCTESITWATVALVLHRLYNTPFSPIYMRGICGIWRNNSTARISRAKTRSWCVNRTYFINANIWLLAITAINFVAAIDTSQTNTSVGGASGTSGTTINTIISSIVILAIRTGSRSFDTCSSRNIKP